MGTQSFIELGLNWLVTYTTDLLIPLMVLAYLASLAFRVLVYTTVKRHDWFAAEFEKRVNRFLEEEDHKKPVSFFVTAKRLLERTYYEIFEVRAIMKRRKPDILMAGADRVFLVKQGCAWLVNDMQKQIRHLKFNRVETQPKLLQLTRSSFQKNPAFNKVFGVIPAGPVNDVLNIMPGMFVIGGIFGTFLGIMAALPELGGMDLANGEQAKSVMNKFLVDIAFSMNTSILGIVLSVTLSFLNTLLSPDKLFTTMVDRFETTLDLLWHRSASNDLPQDIPRFDEHRDPIEALAAESVQQELNLMHPPKPTKAPPPSVPTDKAS